MARIALVALSKTSRRGTRFAERNAFFSRKDKKMMVKCPTCGKTLEYRKDNPWRPFCSERCRLIDLGEWATNSYVIEGEPGSALRMAPEELETLAMEALQKKAKGEH